MQKNVLKLDDVQRASIRRSEAYLRSKALQRPRSTGLIREIITGLLFISLSIAIFIIGLAL